MTACNLKWLLFIICIIISLAGLYLAFIREKQNISRGVADTQSGDIKAGSFNFNFAIGLVLTIIGLVGGAYSAEYLPGCEDQTTNVSKEVSDTSDNKPTSDQQTGISVKGHVYWQDTTPIPNATVIPSLNGVKPITTAENGGFQFFVKQEDILDPIIFTIRSDKIKGTRKKQFNRDSLIYNCNIFLPYNKPWKTISILVSQKNIVKDTLETNKNICSKLITPLKFYLDSSRRVYQNYSKFHRFRDAQILYNLDKQMSSIISANTYLIPPSLNGDVDLLLQNFSIWTISFDNLTANKKFTPESNFQVIYKGSSFPDRSAQAVFNYNNCR